MILAAATLCQRELVRFYRDRARLIGALTPPIVFWFLIGSGLGSSLRLPGAPEGMSYLQYFFSGTLVLIVLFTSVFSTISVIEDRREGFMQSVLVAPIPRLALVAGKVLGASLVGFLQGLTFLLLAPAAGLHAGPEGYALAALTLLLASLGLTGLGFCLAWSLNSTQGFHGVMNLFLIPMWLLSGSLFPASTSPGWLRLVISINPVTYSVAGLQHALSPAGAAGSDLPGVALCLAAQAAFAAATLAASVWIARAARD